MLIIAHRGASAHAPENTMAAFRLALKMNAVAMELDVHQTRDGKLAVIHDWDFRRVGGKRTKIGAVSMAQARAIDVGSWFSENFSSERAPELGDALDLSRGRAELHIELKAGSGKYFGIEERVARLLDKRRAWEWTMISSFDHKALFRMREISSRARLGYLLGISSLRKAWRQTREMRAESLNISVRQARRRVVESAHRRGLKVYVYTVDSPKEFSRLKRIGVDGVYANDPRIGDRPS